MVTDGGVTDGPQYHEEMVGFTVSVLMQTDRRPLAGNRMATGVPEHV